jgi:phosphoribosylformylglycinamidine synthase
MTFHFRQPGREVFLISARAHADASRKEACFGSSEYAREILGETWGFPPALDLKQEAALQKCLRELIHGRHIESAHDCAEGGLAVALAEAAFVTQPATEGQHVGADVNLSSEGFFAEGLLFNEDAGRVVVTCDPGTSADIKRVAVQWGVRAERIGSTIPEKLVIRIDGKTAVTASVSELKQVWDRTLEEAIRSS